LISITFKDVLSAQNKHSESLTYKSYNPVKKG
jgi:hypothetical protein